MWSRALVFVVSGTGETMKPWVSSTDVTDDTGWKAYQQLLNWRTCYMGRGVDSSRRKQSHVMPSVLYICASPKTWSCPDCFPLHPHKELSSREHRGELCHGSSSAGTGMLHAVSSQPGLLPHSPRAPQGREVTARSLLSSAPRAASSLPY